MTSTAPCLFPAERLQRFAEQVFLHHHVPPEQAAEASRLLVLSDLRGIDSHGISRLPTYALRLAEGTVNPTPTLRIVRRTAATATVDGDNGLGLVVGPWANRLAMEMADETGAGWVAVRNSNHFGIAGYYVLQAIERGLIGWAMTNATGWVAPLWGAERRLGTNPIAVGFPAGEETPVVIDMATAAVAYGKIQIALREGKAIPHGWAADREGNDTTDPGAVDAGGTLLPLGGNRQQGGHKGYCLASLVDILCGVLSGANWGPFVPSFFPRPGESSESVGPGVGHFFGALKLDGFIDPDEFRSRLDHWVRVFRATRPAAGTNGPMIPGDPERQATAERRRHGVPLLPVVVDSLRQLASETGVPLEDPPEGMQG